MEILTILFILSSAIVSAHQSKHSKRDEKLLKFRKEVDKIAEDLENFAFDIAKEIVEKSDLYIDPEYDDYEEDSIEDYQPGKKPERQVETNTIPKDNSGSDKKPGKTRTKRSLGTEPDNPERCYKKPQAEQHLEKLHIEDLKEEVRHLYELVTILRDQQRILSVLEQEKDAGLAKDLLRMLDNEGDEGKPFSTHRELAKIKSDLQRAIAALDQTKTVLVQDRRKEMTLEAELRRQQIQLQLLKGSMEGMRENATRPGNDSLLGAALHLPKALPKPAPEARASSSDLEDLVRLLDKIEQPKPGPDKAREEKLRRLQELLDPVPSKVERNAPLRLRLLVQLLEQAQAKNEDDVGVEDELRQLQDAIERLKPKEEPNAFGLEPFFGGKGQPGGGTNAKLTQQQQLVELRKKLDQMIASGAPSSGQPTSNFATGNAPLPYYPFWYANYRNFGPYPNNQGPNAYGYDRGQYGPEQNTLYAGSDGSRYRPENNPYARDFLMNRYRYTTDTNNRFFPATFYYPEDTGAGDQGQAGTHLLPDHRTKDVEELKNQIDALQNVIDSMNYQNYGKRPEDEATMADLERQIKDLRGIVNGLNQEIAPSYSQQASSINQPPPPSFNQSPPTFNQPPNDLPQQPYDAHQVTKRSAVPENEPSSSYNQPLVSKSQSPSSYNQPSPNQKPPNNSLQQLYDIQQMIKKSAVPENSSSALLNRFFKPKTYLFKDSNNKNSSSYKQPPPSDSQPLGSYEPPLSYNERRPRYNEPPSSFSQLSLSYKQSLPSYNQPLVSKGQSPASFEKPPLSYNQPSPNQEAPNNSLQQLYGTHQMTKTSAVPENTSSALNRFFKPKTYLLEDRNNQNSPSYNQPPLSYKQPHPSYSQPLESYAPPLSYNEPPSSYKQALPSYNQPLVSKSQSPASFNKPPLTHYQPYPNQELYDTHRMTKRSAVPENTSSALNRFFKPKTYLLDDSNNQNSPSYSQPLASYEPPLSYNEPPPSYNEPPSSFNQLSPSYKQPPLSYTQLLTSYNAPPQSYNKPPLSYRQLLTSYNKPPPGRSSTYSQLLDEVYSKLKSYLLEDDRAERSSDYEALGDTISSLKAQLDNQHRSYADPEHYVQQPLRMSPRTYSPYGYQYPGNDQIQKSLLPPQKNDLVGAIVVKIFDKILESLPAVFEKLFGELIGGQNGVQEVLKRFGIIGLVPAILLKLIGGLDTFIGVLRGNKFFKSFLLPTMVLLVVSGSVVFLVWWLQGETDYKQISYEHPQDQSFGYPNSYSKSTGTYGYPAPSFLPGYSRSYQEYNQKLNEF